MNELMKKRYNQVYELELLSSKSGQLANMSNALYNAMFCSDNSEGSFDDAMDLFVKYLHHFHTDLVCAKLSVMRQHPFFYFWA